MTRYLSQVGPVTLEAIRARYAFPEAWLKAELAGLIEAREVVHGRFTPGPDRTGAAASEVGAPAAEYVDRDALERIHRRTLHILRQEVRPVPLTVYADFLARWQHVHPKERLAGEGALVQVLQQLRAVPVVGRVWERDVLPLRLAHYQPAELDALCQGGELAWVGCGGVDPRRGRVRLLFRGEGQVYLEPAPEDLAPLDEQARAVYELLRSEGAVFTAEICAALELEAATVEAALVELAMAGLVTNDSLEAMRHMAQAGRASPQEQKPYSSLEAQLAKRRERLGHRTRHRPSRAQIQAAKRRVRRRLEQVVDSHPPASPAVGRWAVVHRLGLLGKAVPVAERAARQTRQLLARYGVVTRECLENEFGSWEWRLIYQQLRRLEMRGEVRRGYFVQGLPGAQYALPEAVERLRAIRDSAEARPELVVMNACDPANLYGPARDDAAGGDPAGATAEPMAGERPGEGLTFARVPSTWTVQHRGLPVLIAGGGGAKLTIPQGTDEGLVQRAVQALLDHLARFERRVKVETWNGEPVLGSAGYALLEAVGFRRDYPAMVWERRP